MFLYGIFSSVAFPHEDYNNCYIGSEDDSIYFAQIHSTAERDADKSNIIDVFSGHNAPLTSLATHPTPPGWLKSHEHSHILLSTSMDWSIKLWNPKIQKEPIASFENSQDYVLDAKWHPLHPSVFASVDAEGYVDLWDISIDMESPVAHLRKDDKTLNRVGWSTDAKRLATGSANGLINVYGADKEYSNPRPEEYPRFERLVQQSLKSSSIFD